MNFEPVIGLEIHVELGTKTKLFCGCANVFGAAPNTQVCPVCLGLPGTLPVLNQTAVEFLLRAGLAFGCSSPEKSKFDRKNYFYPDMPKNYQISQYDLPFAVQGKLAIHAEGSSKEIRIHRIHLEEDTGKSIHAGAAGGRMGASDYTLLDYNRAGVPLIEIVTEPDIRTPLEAVDFLQKLRLTLQTLDISDCKMEEGSMRCDANVSLRPVGAATYGAKVEVKNMNSFKSVRDALIYEIERQTKALQNGERLVQETRAWDEGKKFTFSMRSKEEAHDYRYFPEPDLPPFVVDQKLLKTIQSTLPELPEIRRKRYELEFSLSSEESEFLVESLSLSLFFDQTVKLKKAPKEITNWLRGDVSKLLNEQGKEIAQTKLSPGLLIELIELIEKGTISGKIAKEVLPEVLLEGKSPSRLIEEKGLTQISDNASLEPVILEVLQDTGSKKAVDDYLAGNERSFGFLVGSVMKKTKGKANPQVINQLLKKALDNLKKVPK